jgi:hypothetical protein
MPPSANADELATAPVERRPAAALATASYGETRIG